MAKRTTSVRQTEDLPKDLKDHIFFGLKLDDDQIEFGNKILDEKIKCVFVDAQAGSGKSTVAICTAILMVESGVYSDIVYCTHPVGDAQGFLPGTISEKSDVWFEGLYQAIVTANRVPEQIIATSTIASMSKANSTNLMSAKNGGYIRAVTDTYLRGSTIGSDGKTIFILDEAQNFDEHSLRKTLTRANDNSKVIVIGHVGQIDLSDKEQSGFAKCMEHFRSKGDPRFAFCKLTTNHRGLVSQVADEVWE